MLDFLHFMLGFVWGIAFGLLLNNLIPHIANVWRRRE